MQQQPVSPIIETLKETWQMVLGHPSVGVDDDFFSLGGDQRKAAALFEEIARKYGIILPAATIYIAPSIRKISEILASPTNPPLPVTLLLKPGNPNRPIFLIHGLAGSALDFFDLINNLRTDRAVYGTQAKGSDGLEKPAERIEEMAGYFLEAVRKVQPHGPYSFIGYSLGGLVALEMARQMEAAGEAIDSLCMIESYPAIERAPLGQRIAIKWRVGRMRISEKLKGHADDAHTAELVSPPESTQRVRAADYIALANYEPASYHGKVYFVRAAKSMHFPDSPEAVWRKIIPHMEIATVSGDHHQVLRNHFAELAAALSRYLEKQSNEREAS